MIGLAPLTSRRILGMRVDVTSYDDATERILNWSRLRRGRYVCVSSVNNIVIADHDSEYSEIMNSSDLTTPDGVPVAWALRRLGSPQATRVYGPDLTAFLCRRAGEEGVPVGFYGGSADVLRRLVEVAHLRWPSLEVAYAYSPPFRPPTLMEEARVARDILASGARILFVGLGSPKQETWMHRHVTKLPLVMVGVGAAFDFIAGAKPQAPVWMRRSGLEWLFRLACEPGRLWKRYLVGNPYFATRFALQLIHGDRQAVPHNGNDGPRREERDSWIERP